MINTFVTIETIVQMLKDSQLNQLLFDFAADSSISIKNYYPGDFRIDGVIPSDGAYFYFEETDMYNGQSSPGSQPHEPSFCVDIYSSRPHVGTLDSMTVATQSMYSVVSNIYSCIMHTTFKRKLSDRLKLNVNFGDTLVTKITPSKMQQMENLKPTDGSNALASFRMRFVFAVTETPEQSKYYTLTQIEDRLHAMRNESELADDI